MKGEGSTGGIRGAGGAGGAGKRSMMEGTETEPLLGPAPAPRRTRTSQVPLHCTATALHDSIGH